MPTPTPTITVSVIAGVATLTGTAFRPGRAVCINITGPVNFRKYIHPDKTGALSCILDECTDPGAYSLRATQIGPGGTPVTAMFTK